jgi:hypothetical protein
MPESTVMTRHELHVLEAARILFRREHPISESPGLDAVHSLVRSIVNGEIVPVPCKEIDRAHRDLFVHLATLKDSTSEAVVKGVLNLLAGWLTPDTSKESNG